MHTFAAGLNDIQMDDPSCATCNKCSPRVIDESSPRIVDLSNFSCYDETTIDFDAQSQAIPLRLVTYNIHGWRDTFHKDNLDRLIVVLSRVNADVIALQEVLHPYRPPSDPVAREAYFERVKAGKGNGFVDSSEQAADGVEQPAYLNVLAQALGMAHISFGQATADGYFGRFGYGNAVLSKVPIAREQHLVVRAGEKHQVGRRIEAEDRCFSAVTLAPLGPAAAGAAEGLTVCVTHLDQLSDELRQEQVGAMLAAAAALGPHVFCGDFNVFQRADCSPAQWQAILDDAASKGWPAPPETTAALQALLAAGYADCFYLSDNHRRPGGAPPRLRCEGMSRDVSHPGATCWVTKPLLRIDYALLSPGLAAAAVRQYERMDDDASDHFPAVIDLELAPPAAVDCN